MSMPAGRKTDKVEKRGSMRRTLGKQQAIYSSSKDEPPQAESLDVADVAGAIAGDVTGAFDERGAASGDVPLAGAVGPVGERSCKGGSLLREPIISEPGADTDEEFEEGGGPNDLIRAEVRAYQMWERAAGQDKLTPELICEAKDFVASEALRLGRSLSYVWHKLALRFSEDRDESTTREAKRAAHFVQLPTCVTVESEPLEEPTDAEVLALLGSASDVEEMEALEELVSLERRTTDEVADDDDVINVLVDQLLSPQARGGQEAAQQEADVMIEARIQQLACGESKQRGNKGAAGSGNLGAASASRSGDKQGRESEEDEDNESRKSDEEERRRLTRRSSDNLSAGGGKNEANWPEWLPPDVFEKLLDAKQVNEMIQMRSDRYERPTMRSPDESAAQSDGSKFARDLFERQLPHLQASLRDKDPLSEQKRRRVVRYFQAKTRDEFEERYGRRRTAAEKHRRVAKAWCEAVVHYIQRRWVRECIDIAEEEQKVRERERRRSSSAGKRKASEVSCGGSHPKSAMRSHESSSARGSNHTSPSSQDRGLMPKAEEMDVNSKKGAEPPMIAGAAGAEVAKGAAGPPPAKDRNYVIPVLDRYSNESYHSTSQGDIFLLRSLNTRLISGDRFENFSEWEREFIQQADDRHRVVGREELPVQRPPGIEWPLCDGRVLGNQLPLADQVLDDSQKRHYDRIMDYRKFGRRVTSADQAIVATINRRIREWLTRKREEDESRREEYRCTPFAMETRLDYNAPLVLVHACDKDGNKCITEREALEFKDLADGHFRSTYSREFAFQLLQKIADQRLNVHAKFTKNMPKREASSIGDFVPHSENDIQKVLSSEERERFEELATEICKAHRENKLLSDPTDRSAAGKICQKLRDAQEAFLSMQEKWFDIRMALSAKSVFEIRESPFYFELSPAMRCALTARYVRSQMRPFNKFNRASLNLANNDPIVIEAEQISNGPEPTPSELGGKVVLSSHFRKAKAAQPMHEKDGRPIQCENCCAYCHDAEHCDVDEAQAKKFRQSFRLLKYDKQCQACGSCAHVEQERMCSESHRPEPKDWYAWKANEFEAARQYLNLRRAQLGVVTKPNLTIELNPTLDKSVRLITIGPPPADATSQVQGWAGTSSGAGLLSLAGSAEDSRNVVMEAPGSSKKLATGGIDGDVMELARNTSGAASVLLQTVGLPPSKSDAGEATMLANMIKQQMETMALVRQLLEQDEKREQELKKEREQNTALQAQVRELLQEVKELKQAKPEVTSCAVQPTAFLKPSAPTREEIARNIKWGYKYADFVANTPRLEHLHRAVCNSSASKDPHQCVTASYRDMLVRHRREIFGQNVQVDCSDLLIWSPLMNIFLVDGSAEKFMHGEVAKCSMVKLLHDASKMQAYMGPMWKETGSLGLGFGEAFATNSTQIARDVLVEIKGGGVEEVAERFAVIGLLSVNGFTSDGNVRDKTSYLTQVAWVSTQIMLLQGRRPRSVAFRFNGSLDQFGDLEDALEAARGYVVMVGLTEGADAAEIVHRWLIDAKSEQPFEKHLFCPTVLDLEWHQDVLVRALDFRGKLKDLPLSNILLGTSTHEQLIQTDVVTRSIRIPVPQAFAGQKKEFYDCMPQAIADFTRTMWNFVCKINQVMIVEDAFCEQIVKNFKKVCLLP